ncbi:MAG: hypothetical protein NVSMB51_15740 [Solirubrobacteraceae bacterium]
MLLAAGLRLWSLEMQPANVFYDAAVRSMGLSWHNFFFGSLEPAGSISLDKPPVDLWLQVASTRLAGFNPTALHLPEALGGVAAVGLLFAVVRRLAGTGAALLSGVALAVTPLSVLTARSDTMDSVLVALLLAAFIVSFEALRCRRRGWVLAAAALMGAAFNIKLTESFIALPALALLWWWTAEAPLRRRFGLLAPAAAVLAVVALSWASLASLTPLANRPFPVGSETGSIWRLMFVYNGLDRLSGRGPTGYASASAGGSAGPLRLFDTGGSGYGANIGIEVLAALLAGGGAALLALRARHALPNPRPPLGPAGRACVALGLWLLTGLLVFSAMQRLQPRYLESFAPAVAAVLGIGVAQLVAARGRAAALLLGAGAAVVALYALLLDGAVGMPTAETLLGALAAVAVALWLTVSRRAAAAIGPRQLLGAAFGLAALAAPLGSSLALVRAHRSDSVVGDPAQARVARFLRAHRGATRYEVVGAGVDDVMGIVSRDALPVLVLYDIYTPIVTIPELQQRLRLGEVRYLYVPHQCHPLSACRATTRWALQHSAPVAGVPGVRRFL